MIIDTNVHLSRWPFRRLRGDGSAAELAGLLRAKGVGQAWAGSFDGVFHLDLGAANARLAADCARSGGFFLPFGAVDPSRADWEEELRRCHEEHRMPGIRLYPGYHDYGLDDPRLAGLLRAAAERKLLVQVALKLEDPRVQHRLARVPAADPALLPELPRLMLLNGAADRRFAVDISALEGAAALGALPSERLLFGSHAPFLTWDAAFLKVKEAGLDEGRRRSILESNARRLLAP